MADLTLADLEVLDDEEGDEGFDALLDLPARRTVEPDLDEWAEDPDVWVARWLREAYATHETGHGLTGWIKAKFATSHPRWPKGSPKAGQFMKVGERFTQGGSTFEIGAIQNGKVYAHLADGKNAKEIQLHPSDAPEGKVVQGIEPAAPAKITGGKGKSGSKSGSLVVDPFVDSSSHDPSIKPPEGFDIKPEQWKRFGQADQERLHATIERFGTYSPGKAQKLINQLRKDYEYEIQSVVESALSSQYGSSSGYTLSLSQIFKSAEGSASLAAAQAKYEKARLLLEDVSQAIQWDLYHRTKGPDVCAFHWGGTSVTDQKATHITNGVPIMSAYSMSTGAFQTTGFGSNVTAVPLAIRHVHMHTHSGGLHTGYQSEYEVTTGFQMKLNDKALIISSSGMPSDVKKYLQKHAQNGGEPASGAILEEAKKAINDPSYELPVPPEPPGIKAVPVAGQAAHEMPPVNWLSGKVDIFKLGYPGGATAEEIEKPANQHGFQPGDMMEGLKGTRYLLIEDTAAPMGLRYVKVDPSSGDLIPGKSYQLGGDQPFRKLDGHVDMPKKDPDLAYKGMSQADIDALKPAGPPVKAASLTKGMLFKADGNTFRVKKPSSETGGNPVVEDVMYGKEFFVNSGFKTEPLAHDGAYVPTPDPEVTPEDITAPYDPPHGTLVMVHFGTGSTAVLHYYGMSESGDGAHLIVPGDPATDPVFFSGAKVSKLAPYGPDKPAIGDAFSFEGKKFVISSILKDGTVRAKPTALTVQKFEPGHPALDGLYRPDAYLVGDKAKLKDVPAGSLVSGSPVKVRPYLVVAKVGSTTKLLNLETGEVSTVTSNKSYPVLEAAKSDLDPSPPVAAEFGQHDLSVLADGETITSAQHMKNGGGLLKTYTGALYDYQLGHEGEWYAQKLNDDGTPADGEPLQITENGEPMGTIGDSPVTPLVPKSEAPSVPVQAPTKFEPGAFSKNDWQASNVSSSLKSMEPGMVFESKTGLLMQLKSNTPKGGATAVALHNGKLVKNISYDNVFTVWTPKASSVPDHAQFAHGDTVKAGDLKVGDLLKFPGGVSLWEVSSESTDPAEDIKIFAHAPGGQKVPGTMGPQQNVEFQDPNMPTVKIMTATPIENVPEAQAEWHATYGHYLGSFSDGTVIESADGKLFKKLSGQGTVILADEKGNEFQADGKSGLAVALKNPAAINAFNQNYPGGEPDEDPHLTLLKTKLKDAPGTELDNLSVGDYWEGKGAYKGVWKVTDQGGDHTDVTSVNQETGEAKTFSAYAVPSKVYIVKPEQPDPLSPAMGGYADQKGVGEGDIFFDSDGNTLVATSWAQVKGTNPETAQSIAVTVNGGSGVSVDPWTPGETFKVYGGHVVGEKAKAYTVGQGAAEVEIVSGVVSDTGKSGIKVKLNDGSIEKLPLNAVFKLDSEHADAPDLGPREAPPLPSTHSPVPAGFNADDYTMTGDYMPLSSFEKGDVVKTKASDSIWVVGGDTANGGKYLTWAKGSQPVGTTDSGGGGIQVAFMTKEPVGDAPQTMGDLDVGDTYWFPNPDDPAGKEAQKFEVVAKDEHGVSIKTVGGETAPSIHPLDKPLHSTPMIVKTATPVDAPAPVAAGPMTTTDAIKAGLYDEAEYPTPLADLAEFDLVKISSKRVGYIRDSPALGRRIFPLGSQTPYKGTATAFKKVTMNTDMPHADGGLVDGGAANVFDLPVGSFYVPTHPSAPGGDFQIVGKSDSVAHVKKLDTGGIYMVTPGKGGDTGIHRVLPGPGDEPAPSTAEPLDAFGALQPGAHFEAHGAIWQKQGGGQAVLIHKDPGSKQGMNPGDVEKGWENESVNWLQDYAPDAPEQFDPEEGQLVTLAKGTMFGQPADEKFKVIANYPATVVLDNNKGGEIQVGKDTITAVHPAEPEPVGPKRQGEEPAMGLAVPLPEGMIPNPGGLKLKDMKPGDYYAYPEAGGWDVKKITQVGGGDVAATAGEGFDAPSAGYAPDQVWIAPEDAAQSFKGQVFSGGDPMYAGDGAPIMQGEDVWVKAKDGVTWKKGSAVGSGNIIGEVKVMFDDGGWVPRKAEQIFHAKPEAKASTDIHAAKLTDLDQGYSFKWEPNGERWVVVAKQGNSVLMVKPENSATPIIPVPIGADTPIYDHLPF